MKAMLLSFANLAPTPVLVAGTLEDHREPLEEEEGVVLLLPVYVNDGIGYRHRGHVLVELKAKK